MEPRTVRYLGSRSCGADDAKVLYILPTFPGEHLKSVRMSAYVASGDSSGIDQPSELNWYGLYLPYETVFAGGLAQNTPAFNDLSTVAKYDELFRMWVQDIGLNGTEVWGGDVELAPNTPQVATEAAAQGPMKDQPYGPIGPKLWFRREIIARPYAAEGVNVIRFGDDFEASLSQFPGGGFGGLYLFGMARFHVAAETNFTMELDDNDAKMAFGFLAAGDYGRATELVRTNTAHVGDIMRSLLYGGDNYVEADCLKEAAMKAHVKATAIVMTPIRRRGV